MKKKMKKYVMIFVFVMIGVTGKLAAQNQAKNQALYVYNFTRNIEWPAYSSQDFVIGVLGNSDIYNELVKTTTGKNVGSKTIIVKKFNSANEISTCQILFVSGNVSSSLATFATTLQNKNTLIITDRPGLTNKGAGINFVLDDGKQKFELSKRTINKTGLKVSDQLVDMAILTD